MLEFCSTERNNHYICGINPNAMIDGCKVFLHSVEMAEHANGAAQYLEALLGGIICLQVQRGTLNVALLQHKNRRMQRYLVGNFC